MSNERFTEDSYEQALISGWATNTSMVQIWSVTIVSL